MQHADKIAWMHEWAKNNGAELTLEGECGFGRECVGVLVNDLYPDYEWYDSDYTRIDDNGDVWTPENAYHKHPCVAVLGRGREAEEQLYNWLQWFSKNEFVVETGDKPLDPGSDAFERALNIMLGEDRYSRVVRKGK